MFWATTLLLAFLTPQTESIERARQVALEYTASLPNFVATQTTEQQHLKKGSGAWKTQNTLIFDVAFTDGTEQYTLLTINGKPTTKKKGETGGLNTSGEFGSDLRKVFRPESQATFKWEHSTQLRGRSVDVFSYHIEQEHSGYYWRLDGEKGKEYKGSLPYTGAVYVDRETNQVLRLTTLAQGVPAEWPLSGASEEIDYDFVSIEGREYLLPTHAETRAMAKNGDAFRTIVEFSNYHRFSTGVTLTTINQ
jgi:hypothetical protein